MGRLDQKTVLVTVLVLVTGGANGAGAASVLRFCEEGALLVFVDRDRLAGEMLAASLAGLGHAAHFIAADVAMPDQAAAA